MSDISSSPAAAASSRRTRRRRWVLGIAAVLAIGAALWFMNRPVEVDGLVPPHGPLKRTLEFTARVQSPLRVDLGPTITGRVASVEVQEGDRFEAGMPLVRLEDDELSAALVQSEAARTQAQAALRVQDAVARPSADAALAQSDANLGAAQREFERSNDLLAQGFVSHSRVDDAARALAVARAQRDAARVQARANARGGIEVEAARARLDAAVAVEQMSAARLAQATLRAPAPGRVLVRNVEPGQIVQPGRALLMLAIDAPLEMVAAVDERFLSTLATGQSAHVLADAYPTAPFAATVTRLAPSVDAARGAVEVRLRPTGKAPAFLREDMTLSVEVVTGERADARLLPLRALRPGATATHGSVLVAAHGRAAVREVELGLRTLDQVELRGGLADGEAVLLDTVLKEGTRVDVRLVDLSQALGGPAGLTSRDSTAPAMHSTGR